MIAALIGLSVVILMLGFASWRLFQTVHSDRRCTNDPASLRPVLWAMTERVKKRGEWSELEGMRNELRRALAEVDRMRHDAGDHKMRESKRVAEAL